MILETELNVEGRVKRGSSGMNIKTPSSAEFVDIVMKGIEKDQFQIGFGSSEDSRIATKEELDRRFYMMNNR